MARHPGCYPSITSDNGGEFHSYREVEGTTATRFYFAAPHHSWERGTNENTNGLIRQCLPKGMSFDNLTQQACDAIARKLNNRPRKRLGYQSPEEVFNGALHACTQASSFSGWDRSMNIPDPDMEILGILRHVEAIRRARLHRLPSRSRRSYDLNDRCHALCHSNVIPGSALGALMPESLHLRPRKGRCLHCLLKINLTTALLALKRRNLQRPNAGHHVVPECLGNSDHAWRSLFGNQIDQLATIRTSIKGAVSGWLAGKLSELAGRRREPVTCGACHFCTTSKSTHRHQRERALIAVSGPNSRQRPRTGRLVTVAVSRLVRILHLLRGVCTRGMWL